MKRNDYREQPMPPGIVHAYVQALHDALSPGFRAELVHYHPFVSEISILFMERRRARMVLDADTIFGPPLDASDGSRARGVALVDADGTLNEIGIEHAARRARRAERDFREEFMTGGGPSDSGPRERVDLADYLRRCGVTLN